MDSCNQFNAYPYGPDTANTAERPTISLQTVLNVQTNALI